MGIAERKERDRLRRRNEIIDAAEIEFFEHGFESATVESIAAQAELSKATVYLYFKSKEELYFAVCMRGQDKMFSLIDQADNSAESPIDRIKAYLHAIVRFQEKYPDYFQALFYFQTHPIHQTLDEENLDVQRNREIDNIYIGKWIHVVDQGKKEGFIRPDLNPHTTVLLIWMQLSGFLKMYSVMNEEINRKFNIKREEMLEDYFELVFKGISKK